LLFHSLLAVAVPLICQCFGQALDAIIKGCAFFYEWGFQRSLTDQEDSGGKKEMCASAIHIVRRWPVSSPGFDSCTLGSWVLGSPMPATVHTHTHTHTHRHTQIPQTTFTQTIPPFARSVCHSLT